ncbi:hypothetical protein MBLNU459_g2792t1 [Dothideomycetes sp. NU459]
MFSSQLGRVARAGASLSGTASTAAHRTPACLTAAAAAVSSTPRSHPPSQQQQQQRRYSSSKPSCPPDGDSNGPRAAAPAQASTASQPSRPASGKSSNGRKAGARRAREASEQARSRIRESDEAFGKLPSVPSTHHLHPQDITLSSFFSLHRPISLTAAIPPSTDLHTFEAIFDSRPVSKADSKNAADVIYTLSNTIDSLDAKTQPDRPETDLRWEIIQESPSNTPDGVKHLDGPPRAKSIEQLLAQLKPFSAPPPPVSSEHVVQQTKSGDASRKRNSSHAAAAAHSHEPVSEKSFKTTLIVTECTSVDGAKYYTAQTSPMVQINNSSSHQHPTAVQEPGRRQTFLERMRDRQAQYEEYRDERAEQKRDDEAMHAISVKRQRKLKMKKHKYKKLMKRTRNLRRRLDRN